MLTQSGSRTMSHLSLRICAFALLATAVAVAWSSDPVPSRGTDFSGGASSRFGADKNGKKVNYVYAQPTGPFSRMQLAFKDSSTTAQPQFLHLEARGDDAATSCPVQILLNGTTLYQGPHGFSSKKWDTRKFPIPSGLLKAENKLEIVNISEDGQLGLPPWFMVSSCVVAPQDFVYHPDPVRDFHVDLPTRQREFPEPLPAGAKPGFQWRGTKGWLWTPEQYLAEIPYLTRCKMNFLMNCYGSMCDIENTRFGDPKCNRWYESLPPAKKAKYQKVVKACQDNGITFCFSMNPNLSSSRFVNSGKPEDVDALWQHYAWMQSLGVQWFNISLDDISQGINAVSQAKVVNEIFHRLRKKDPDAQMIFCPTYYWGDGTTEQHRNYLSTLAKELAPDVYLFWTGDAVVGPITRKGAESYKSISGHRLFLWDNYPVNDGHPTMHLGPVINRDPELCEVVDGYMCNPMHSENEANRIPLFTCADYAYNPRAYDPIRSIGQAILNIEKSPERREVMRNMVEAYPGMLICNSGSTAFNAVREQHTRLLSAPHSRQVGDMYIRGIQDLAKKMDQAFPDEYSAEKRTVKNDIRWMKDSQVARYAE